jgi:hypothetical protein
MTRRACPPSADCCPEGFYFTHSLSLAVKNSNSPYRYTFRTIINKARSSSRCLLGGDWFLWHLQGTWKQKQIAPLCSHCLKFLRKNRIY